MSITKASFSRSDFSKVLVGGAPSGGQSSGRGNRNSTWIRSLKLAGGGLGAEGGSCGGAGARDWSDLTGSRGI
jgi:hypothetical protein